jgi:phospholipase/carboxylesterase
MTSQESATRADAPAESPGRLETVEIVTGADPTAAVIWLHGLGADGHDFEPLVPELSWPGAPSIRYVFPHAPVRPITINGGIAMRAWYDIVSLSGGRDSDREGVEQSIGLASSLIDRERQRGITADRIIVAGFSQGGAIAIHAALRYPDRLAGLVALSTYLLQEDRLESEAGGANADLPVFAAHGTVDPMVPCAWGEDAAVKLRELGHPVEWNRYAMPHAVCPQEIGDLLAWLRQRLD